MAPGVLGPWLRAAADSLGETGQSLLSGPRSLALPHTALLGLSRACEARGLVGRQILS